MPPVDDAMVPVTLPPRSPRMPTLTPFLPRPITSLLALPCPQLRKDKNDAKDQESWVQCDHCERWQHQVCALYNGKRNEGSDIPHYCPHCILGHMTARKQVRVDQR